MSMKRFYSWEMKFGKEGNSFGRLGFSEGISYFRGVRYEKIG